eukprot:TRINITY_DN37037_c0_g2_i1.p1 TRINITY_DN37037_c0_g2~~TRINITY_DN37037_c0_g2_i1.p1  ORF type:complete len:645 (+),score=77.34 TRINITY_DN37037_c0_g2_i1:124-2058(+)
MICIVVVAGHNDRLEREIAEDLSETHKHLKGVPKALLPASRHDGRTILGRWWAEIINTRQIFKEVYLVTNADKYKHYERWATANDFPVENIINDGTTTFESRIGAVADLDLVLRSKKISDSDILVVAGDMLFSTGFDISGVYRFFNSKDGDVAVYYDMARSERTETRGIVEVENESSRITSFFEKPAEGSGITTSRLASVVFYMFRKSSFPFLRRYLDEHTDVDSRSWGRYLTWIVTQKLTPVYGMKLPTAFQLIGQTSLTEYLSALDHVSREGSASFTGAGVITRRAYARVGLVGNPSDGFFGKTIAVSVDNFWAEVSIEQSEKLRLVPHPLNDPNEFGSLSDLHCISRKEGYQGGLIMLQATCKKFYEYCSKGGISLPKRNFTLKYTTNIPRQVGLAGSSAIVTAVLQCLMEFYNLSYRDIPKHIQPSFVLSVETDELFIQAGLQDRVIQTYEGCMYMDFSRELMETRGYGEYLRLPIENLPYLWLAYLSDPSNSGKIHSDVKERWKRGEEVAVQAMRTFAEYTERGREAIERKDWPALGEVMNDNFALRRKVYGDACLGENNLAMIAVAQEIGVPVKFPGSGGAVVGMAHTEDEREKVKQIYEEKGYVFAKLIPHVPNDTATSPSRKPTDDHSPSSKKAGY